MKYKKVEIKKDEKREFLKEKRKKKSYTGKDIKEILDTIIDSL